MITKYRAVNAQPINYQSQVALITSHFACFTLECSYAYC